MLYHLKGRSEVDIAQLDKQLYCSQFGQTLLDLNPELQLNYSGYRCYSSVFTCLSLFRLACERYKSISIPSQDIFAILVLEPLLLLSVGLLLYRIRSNEYLYEVSIASGTASFSHLLFYISIDLTRTCMLC